MTELKRGDELKSPGEKQDLLKSYYSHLVQIEDENLALLSTNQVYPPNQAVTTIEMLNKEEANMNIRKSLEDAQITDALKGYIIGGFRNAFRVGVYPASRDFFDIIGITDVHPLPEGVYSKDPNVRKQIERTVYLMKKEDLEALGDSARHNLEYPGPDPRYLSIKNC
jgi:hypothetical protein